MTNLTEQWKKRTLPSGVYYIKLIGGDILPAFCNTEYILKQFQTMRGIYDMADIEVLAPVPSYEEWQANQKWIKSLEEKIKIYKRKDKQATETSIAYNELLTENAILKELLKDCRLAIFDYPPYDLASDKIRLTNKIDEVLK